MSDSEPGSNGFSYEDSPHLYLFTSLTAGSSHIITATSRLETILKANRIPFKAVDCATDEKARRIWTRRSSGKKLPGLVKEGFVVADLPTVEEWNEYGEIKENLGDGVEAAKPASATKENQTSDGASANAISASVPINSSQADASAKMQPQQSLAEEAAALAKSRQQSNPWKNGAFGPSTTTKAASVPAPTTVASDPVASKESSPSPEPTNEKISSSPDIPPPGSPSRSPYSGVNGLSPGKSYATPETDIDMSVSKHNTTPSTALPPLNGTSRNGSSPNRGSPARASAPDLAIADPAPIEEPDPLVTRSGSDPTEKLQPSQISSLSTALENLNGKKNGHVESDVEENGMIPLLGTEQGLDTKENGVHKGEIHQSPIKSTASSPTRVKFQDEEVKPEQKASVSLAN